MGGAECRAEWNEQMFAAAQAAVKAGQDARAKEQALNATIATQQRKYQDESLKLRTDNAALVEWLSSRPNRPASAAPADAGTPAGCTGAGLYKSDSEFLARLARDADELRLGLKACYSQYNAAVDILRK
jgi:hypothetical protein